MNKNVIVISLMTETGLHRAQCVYALEIVIDVLKKELIAGGSIHIKGFGAFKTVEHQARKGVNPATGEKIVIPKRKVAVFKVSKGFMNAINEKK